MAKTLYFRNLAATMHRGNNDATLAGAATWWTSQQLADTRGPAVFAGDVNSVLGPTNGLEVADAGIKLEWLSEPLLADFTISGTITLNLWAFELTMNDNIAINAVIEKMDGATGTLTQIAKTARVTEVALTSAAVNNFTVTPTSTACKRGDRLRIRVFADDAGTMAAGGSMSFRYNGAAGVEGDSFVTFTETLTFEPLTDPTGSTYYLTDTAETINPGSAIEKKASTTRGSGTVNTVTNTATGPTAGIQLTNSAGGTAVEWYTPPLQAVTFGGRALFNLRGLESAAGANASLKAEVAICANDGSSAVVWGVAGVRAITTYGSTGELSTSQTGYVAYVSGDDTAVTAGQRLRFRVYVDDCGSAPLVTGQSVTVGYNGTTVGDAGDTYVILPVTVTEQATGPTTWTGAATVSLTDSPTTAGIRQTFAVAVVSEADIRQTGGVRKTTSVATVALVTNLNTAGVATAGAKLGSATVTAVATITTTGTRRTTGLVTVALVNTRTTAGTRKTTGVATRPLVATVTTIGTRKTTGATATTLVANRTTIGRVTMKAATATGELVTVTTIAALAGDKIGTTTVALIVGVSTIGRRATTTTSTVAPAVTVTTLGRRVAAGASTSSLVVARTTTGRVGARTSVTVPVLVNVLTSTRKVWLAASSSSLTATITTQGARLQYGTATIGEAVQITVDTVWQLNDAAGVLLTASVFTSATSLTPLPGAPIMQTTDGLIGLTTSGTYSHTGSGNINDHQEGTLVGTTTGRIIG